MRSRRIVLALLFFLAATTASAQTFIRGDVAFQTKGDPSLNAWLFRPGPWTCCAWPIGGAVLIYKIVPFVGPGRLFVASPNVILFHNGHTVSWWNGVYQYFELPGKGYDDIFTDGATLTEIVPLRPGHFLVGETRSDRGAKLIEFDLQGKIGEIPFEGANHIELLADLCTLLYTNGDSRVRRFNICTQRQESDFATLLPAESAGAVRQMPNGDVLVAARSAVLRFRDSAIWTFYPFPGVTEVALSDDGSSFWAAGVQNQKPILRHYDATTGLFDTIEIGSPRMQPPASATEITDLAVVSEWRASATPARARGVRHR